MAEVVTNAKQAFLNGMELTGIVIPQFKAQISACDLIQHLRDLIDVINIGLQADNGLIQSLRYISDLVVALGIQRSIQIAVSDLICHTGQIQQGTGQITGKENGKHDHQNQKHHSHGHNGVGQLIGRGVHGRFERYGDNTPVGRVTGDLHGRIAEDGGFTVNIVQLIGAGMTTEELPGQFRKSFRQLYGYRIRCSLCRGLGRVEIVIDLSNLLLLGVGDNIAVTVYHHGVHIGSIVVVNNLLKFGQTEVSRQNTSQLAGLHPLSPNGEDYRGNRLIGVDVEVGGGDKGLLGLHLLNKPPAVSSVAQLAGGTGGLIAVGVLLVEQNEVGVVLDSLSQNVILHSGIQSTDISTASHALHHRIALVDVGIDLLGNTVGTGFHLLQCSGPPIIDREIHTDQTGQKKGHYRNGNAHHNNFGTDTQTHSLAGVVLFDVFRLLVFLFPHTETSPILRGVSLPQDGQSNGFLYKKCVQA